MIHELIVFSISVNLQFTRLYFSQHNQTKLPGQTVTGGLTNNYTAGGV